MEIGLSGPDYEDGGVFAVEEDQREGLVVIREARQWSDVRACVECDTRRNVGLKGVLLGEPAGSDEDGDGFGAVAGPGLAKRLHPDNHGCVDLLSLAMRPHGGPDLPVALAEGVRVPRISEIRVKGKVDGSTGDVVALGHGLDVEGQGHA